ncbi:MAG: formyltransferase family protein [Caldilineaceae bacterium]
MPNSAPLRALFWGTRSAFSGAVFHSLQRANVHICALFIHTPPTPWQADTQPRRAHEFHFPTYAHGANRTTAPLQIALELAAPAEPKATAKLHQISAPVYEIFSLRSPELTALITHLQPDVACVACFPQRIPLALLKLPKHGFFNVHPSLLPAHRGPAPLFWIFRSGAPETAGGVTIHRMDADFDSGAIAAQAALELADGISGPTAEQRCAQKGGELLVGVLDALAAGKLTTYAQAAGGSYQSWPQAQDFQMDTSWSAQRAFNFMRGAAEWGIPFAVDAGGARLHLQSAIAYDASQKLSVPVLSTGDSIVQIQFAPGVLIARRA